MTMKTLTQLMLVTLIICSASCSDEVKSLKKIDGKWKITSLTFYGKNTADSTYTNDNFTLDFEKCNKKDNHSPGCRMTLQLNGKNYKYFYSIDGDRILLDFDSNDPATVDFESKEGFLIMDRNVWDILTLNDSELSLRKNINDEDFVEITAIK